jgi:hypothetical protein
MNSTLQLQQHHDHEMKPAILGAVFDFQENSAKPCIADASW